MASEQSPAFQFYPKEFITDGNVSGMSLQERGALITEIMESVLRGDRKRFASYKWRFLGRAYWRKHVSRRYLSPAVRREVFTRHGLHCLRCGSVERIELDHIVPYSKGGLDTADNLQPLCKPCNCRKGAN